MKGEAQLQLLTLPRTNLWTIFFQHERCSALRLQPDKAHRPVRINIPSDYSSALSYRIIAKAGNFPMERKRTRYCRTACW
jgi:hypothetical protein